MSNTENLTPLESEVIFSLARLGEIADAQTARMQTTIDDVKHLREQVANMSALVEAQLAQITGKV